MKRILADLNRTAGIRGSMVMTQDGIMAASALGPDLEEDVVAALATALLTTVKKSFHHVAAGESLVEFILTASDGKMVFLDMGLAYLVVVAKRDMALTTTMVEIRSAAHRIKNRRASTVQREMTKAR